MIIETRYRDVPWEEVRKCAGDGLTEEDWDDWRGKPIRIISPPPPLRVGAKLKCEGPHYPVAKDPTSGVCVHIVEIGD